MQTIYTKYYEFAELSKTLPEDFMDLFENLLLQTNGNIDQIMDFLQKYNDQYGFYESQEQLDEFKEMLENNDLVGPVEGKFELTPKGRSWLRERIFKNFFKRIKMNNEGDHKNRFLGRSPERTTENRPYRHGDDFSNVDMRASMNNALRRSRGERFNLNYNDLETKDSVGASSVATVLLVDISHSMILYGEDRITPAKKVAIALCELIKTKYPKDRLHVCVFGNDAWEIPLSSLDKISVGPFHTNTLAGIQLAKKLLKKYPHLDKQIIMITDGKPTCLKEAKGYYKNSFGLDPYIVNKILKESINCRRQKINISTFMLTKEHHLVEFVDEFTKLNSGRAFHVNLKNLSSSVMVDYLHNRKKRYR